jgi:hypothetical protein
MTDDQRNLSALPLSGREALVDFLREKLIGLAPDVGLTYSEVRECLSALDQINSDASLVLAISDRLQRYEEALRYIDGEDIAGYEAHMRPEEVVKKALRRV